MDAVLTDSRLDTRIKRCILMNAKVPKLLLWNMQDEYGKIKAKFAKQLDTAQLTAC